MCRRKTQLFYFMNITLLDGFHLYAAFGWGPWLNFHIWNTTPFGILWMEWSSIWTCNRDDWFCSTRPQMVKGLLKRKQNVQMSTWRGRGVSSFLCILRSSKELHGVLIPPAFSMFSVHEWFVAPQWHCLFLHLLTKKDEFVENKEAKKGFNCINNFSKLFNQDGKSPLKTATALILLGTHNDSPRWWATQV